MQAARGIAKDSPDNAIALGEVLDALRDPIRLEIARRLAGGEKICSSFADLGSPSGLSYHFRRLRTAGLTNTRKAGTCKLISLRAAEVERAFPGVLTSILKVAEKAAERQSPAKKPKSRSRAGDQ